MYFLKDSHKIGVLGEMRKKTFTEPSESTEEQHEGIWMKKRNEQKVTRLKDSRVLVDGGILLVGSN